MMCAWNEVISILPVWMREDVNLRGKGRLSELRIRKGAPPELIMGERRESLQRAVSAEDISFCINAASRYSPWTAQSESEGYITISGGHRIGLCGEAVIKDGLLSGFHEITSLCIRIARDFNGIWSDRRHGLGSVLFLGAPGWGKTTLLRDCARYLAETKNVSVVDERGELFPSFFKRGKNMDVLSGCPKRIGIEIVLRTMRPEYIAVDEITSPADTEALIRAVGCGAALAATAHAASIDDFSRHSVYQPLITHKLFDTVVQLHSDLTYSIERINT